ncbi:hypothetical protein Mmc1_0627 [Magnetococcus marinus MC-1]|uniref:Spore protein YkvP/CgeB glycosyl transferase-like domain-containing protein n=2 Tax=Magnetococcus TaxID=162171 RepID=A0L5A5_MAGMM|nr:hypothetical protein Mmc1_0627 [Magnetococcus marinus MC-1]
MVSKVLLLYGYHYGTTGSFIEQSLRRQVQLCAVGAGHEQATEPGWRAGCERAATLQEIYQLLPRDFEPEVILVVESGEKFFPDGLQDAPCPCWYYAIDPHFNGEWQRDYALLFDRLFVSFKQYLPLFENVGHPWVRWLPHAYDPHVYYDHGAPERDIDIAFVGDMDPQTRPQRVMLLQALQAAGLQTCFTKGIWKEEVAKLFSRSKLVFNHNHDGVFNPRNFEGSSCGSVVVTNPAENLTDFFTPGENILIYEDAPSLVKLVQVVLSQPERLAQLAAGAAAVVKQHSWDQRMIDLFTMAQEPAVPIRTHFSQQQQMRANAMVYQSRGLPGKALSYWRSIAWQVERDFEVPVRITAIYAQFGFFPQMLALLVELLEMPNPPVEALMPLRNFMVEICCEQRHTRGAELLLEHFTTIAAEQRQKLQALC